jgi:hypothetical protein
VPITAKLSRQFYEKLGDEVTNELVTWLNAVDDSYRAEFRDLFAANFGQVRAEMAALRSELRADMAALRSELHADMALLRSELHGEMDTRLGEVRGEMAALRTELAALDHRVEKRLAAQKNELLLWMFLFWIGTVGALLLKTGL